MQWDPLKSTSADTSQAVFLALFAALFIVCIIWFVAELTRAIAGVVVPTAPSLVTFATGACVALLLYAGAAVGTWSLNPVPRDSTSETGDRLYLSALWPIGLLQETGNYSPTFCGE